MVAANALPYDPSKTPEQNRAEGRPDRATDTLSSQNPFSWMTYDPPVPSITYTREKFAKACVYVDVLPDQYNTHRNLPFVKEMTRADAGILNEAFQDVSSTNDFWNLHLVGAYEHHLEATGIAYDQESVFIFYNSFEKWVTGTKTASEIESWNSDDDNIDDDWIIPLGLTGPFTFVSNYTDRTICHEILHQFIPWELDPQGNGFTWIRHHATGGIMDYFTMNFLDDDSACDLNLVQIKHIQSNPKPVNTG